MKTTRTNMNATLSRELFRRHPDNPILSVRDWPYDANSVFNAAAAEVDGNVLLLVRVEDFRGISHFTAARSDDGVNNWHIDTEPTLRPEPASRLVVGSRFPRSSTGTRRIFSRHRNPCQATP